MLSIKNYRVGSFLNTPLYVNNTTVIGIIVLTILNSFNFPLMVAVCIPFMLYFSIIFHEYGHVFAAKKFGISTQKVVLHPIGGVAYIMRQPQTLKEEITVAIAGPMSNIVLMLLAFLPCFYLSCTKTNLFFLFSVLNLVFAIFNLLPFYPLDGGRVLRGVLWTFLGQRSSLKWAAKVGQCGAILLGILGIVSLNPLLLFIAYFIYKQATQEFQSSGHYL